MRSPEQTRNQTINDDCQGQPGVQLCRRPRHAWPPRRRGRQARLPGHHQKPRQPQYHREPRKLAIIVKHGTFGNIGSHGNVGPSAATAPSASSVASASSRRQVRNHGNITNVGNAQASTYAQTRTERTRTRSSPISCLLYSDEFVFKIQGPLFVLFPDFWMATRHLMYNVQVLVTAIASPRHAP